MSSVHGRKPLLIFEEFLHREHCETKEGAKRYQCTKEKSCKAFVIVNEIRNRTVTEHNHLPEPDKIETKKIMKNIKGATSTLEKPRQIVIAISKTNSQFNCSLISKLDAVRQTINYNSEKAPAISETNSFSRKDIILPQIFTTSYTYSQ